MSRLLLADCRLVATVDDADTEVRDCSIGIENGWITHVGPGRPLREWDEVIDGRRYLAVPGFVNTHHHLYQTLTRAFPESVGQPLFSWLETLYPIWAGLDEDMIFASTRAGLAELMLSGCTTCADHLYVFPSGSEHFIDVEVAAARTLGVRFQPTRGSMDLSRKRGGLPPDSVVQSRDVIIRDSERVIREYHDPNPGAMIRIGLAPCSPFSVTTELMLETAGLAREEHVRLHTHIAETMDEDAYSRQKFGVSPVELLERLGWVQSDVWLAHCVHPGQGDIDVIAQGGAAVAHCPTSNMLLGSGLAPVRQLLAAGIPVGLGVDGTASNDSNDMRQEIKQAVLVSRVRDGATAMPARHALRLATRGGAACLGRDDIGSIEVGKAGDIALFDSESLQWAGGQEDLIASMVLGAAEPAMVLVHGKIVGRDGELANHDRRELASDQNAASARLMAKWREI